MMQNPTFGSIPHIHPNYPDFGMGRLPALDFRDRGFKLTHTLEHAVSVPPPPRRSWHIKEILDQGNTPQCVAFAGESFLAANPVANQYYKTPADLYALCQQNDEWAGQPHDGSSGRGLFKALQSLGYIKSYQWADSFELIEEHLLAIGPVVLGTNWYESMFDVDSKGYAAIASNAAPAGGHEYIGVGVDGVHKNPDGSIGRIRIANSWGRSWGQNGRAWISSADIKRLLAEYGDACTAIELKFQPLPAGEIQ